MKFLLTQKCDCTADTIVRFVKPGSAPTFTCETLQSTFDNAFGTDANNLEKGEIRVLRMRLKDNFTNIVLIGYDCGSKTAMADFKKATAKLGAKLNELKAKNVLVDKLTSLIFADKDEIVRQFCTELPHCEYQFDKYLTKKNENKGKTVSLLAEPSFQAAVDEAAVLAEGVEIARDLTNEIADVLTPAGMANTVTELSKKYGFEVKVYNADECAKMGMNLFLAVGRASVNEPKLIVMRHNGGKKGDAPIGIIGKGLTYDSGGLCLKQGKGMETMHGDMAGASAVIGAMCAIAKNNLPHNVVTVVAACENVISGKAYHTGDIFTSMNGKTVHVGNTDAEGRLTLADAMTYSIRNEKVKNIIELSTLTGANANFFGTVCAAVLTTDDDMFKKLDCVSEMSGEKFSRLPHYEEFREVYKTALADLDNTSNTGTCGGISAGLFLDEFHENTPFMHVDVAGTTYTKSASDGQGVGGTGFGVKSVYNYVKKQ